MASTWRISLFVGLAILVGGTTATAQIQPGVGTDDGSEPAPDMPPAATPPPSSSALAPIRSPATSSYFNRTTTIRRSPASSPGIAAGGGAALSEAMGRQDPLRPYSDGVRQADRRAVMGSTRPQPRAASPPRMAQSPHNYYPTLRGSRHPNANVPPVRRPRTGTVMGMGTGMGIGMGMGARSSMPKPGRHLGPRRWARPIGTPAMAPARCLKKARREKW